MSNLDKWIERQARRLAQETSRRTMLACIGAVMTGVAALPLLPVSRLKAAEAQDPGDPGDQTSCDYWRYCAIDGFLCSCCGGSVNSCPPGTVVSPITWIGTCQNPADGKHYVISYNDCCGRTGCGKCTCNTNERELPMHTPHANNDINWCAGSDADIIYNCSIAMIVGVSDEPS